jgi:hypothetical protein
MASLEKRGRGYRIVFRYLGEKYSRGLRTRSEVAARAVLARVTAQTYELISRLPTNGRINGSFSSRVGRAIIGLVACFRAPRSRFARAFAANCATFHSAF